MVENNLIDYLTLIPARKNSKRIKRKNIVLIKGKELIKYTIEQAIGSNLRKNVIVSSDDERVIKISEKYKVKCFMRSKKLAVDNATTESVIKDILQKKFGKNYIKFVKNIILLQATSPLRKIKDIKDAIKFYEKGKFDSLFSAYLSKEFVWKNIKKPKSISYDYKKRLRTQNMEELIFENGAIFIFKAKGFKRYQNRLFGKIGVFLMKKHQSIDIDVPEDINYINKLI